MKYIIEFVKELPSSSAFNAWSKAPADVIRTLSDIGYSLKLIKIPEKTAVFAQINVFWNILKYVCNAKSDDEIIIQSYGKYVDFLLYLAKKKKVRIIYLIHDVTFLRLGVETTEKRTMNKADLLIVHTEEMQKFLQNQGIKTKMRILHLFDYYTDDKYRDINEVANDKNIVAFAGNLSKSQFLEKLQKTKTEGISYNLYGLKSRDIKLTEPFSYKGAFKPENVSFINAGWGLVWDGDSDESCTGIMGNYLKYNSPHKVSLYLSSGIPVIIWKNSALADWLNEQGVCLLIDSLNDIPKSIASLKEEDYISMIKKTREIGDKLRNGYFLKKTLDAI